MVSLSYGGCCVRGLCVIEVQRAEREGAAAVGRRLPKRNNKDPQHPQQRDTQTGNGRGEQACSSTEHVFVNMWRLWRGTDAKIEKEGTVGIFCEELRKETIAIATALTLPWSHNSVISDASHCLIKYSDYNDVLKFLYELELWLTGCVF